MFELKASVLPKCYEMQFLFQMYYDLLPDQPSDQLACGFSGTVGPEFIRQFFLLSSVVTQKNPKKRNQGENNQPKRHNEAFLSI